MRSRFGNFLKGKSPPNQCNWKTSKFNCFCVKLMGVISPNSPQWNVYYSIRHFTWLIILIETIRQQYFALNSKKKENALVLINDISSISLHTNTKHLTIFFKEIDE